MSREREWGRKQILHSPDFRAVAIQVIEPLLDKIPLALVGGLAVSHYVNPPVTVDIDLLTIGTVKSIQAELVPFIHQGWQIQPLWFPHRQKGLPRNGVKLIQREPYSAEIDFIATNSDKFLTEAVESAVPVKLHGIGLPIITIENLIVMKALAGREKDLDDIKLMFELKGSEIDQTYVNNKIDELE